MSQTYKMMLGTSGKQWEQLTVKDDGTMTMYFHGTDRSVTQEVTVITEGEWKGWLRSEKGSLWPGLASGRWNKMDDGRCMTEPLTMNPEPLTMNRQTSDTMKAIGMVAAATVALFVIYETGLLIPLGLIGLATGGLLK